MEYKKIFIVIELSIIFIISITIGSLLFTSPFFGDFNLIDEGQFAAWANHMVHGKLMFKDIYITYGPLFVWPLYFLFKIFGPSAFLTRIYFTFASQIVSIVIVTLLINQFKISQKTKLLMVLGVTLIPGLNIRMGVAYLTILFLIKSIRSKNIIWCFFSGMSCVVAFLVSPETGILSVGLVVLYSIYLFSVKNLEFAIKISIWIFLGMMSILTSFMFWAGKEGWLYYYFRVTLDVFISFSGMNIPNGQKYPDPLETFPTVINSITFIKYIISQKLLLYWQAFFYLVVFIYLFIRMVLKKLVFNDLIILGIVLYAFFLYVTLIGKHGGYYLTFAPIIIFSLYFTEMLLGVIKKSKNMNEKWIAFVLILLLILFLVRLTLIFRPNFNRVFLATNAFFSHKKFPPKIGPVALSERQHEYILKLQNYIRMNTTKEDYVFIFTNEPFIYMFSNRINPTRYDLPYVAGTIDKRYELLNDLKIKKPKLIIEDTQSWKIDGIGNRERLPEVYNFIISNYEVDSKINGIIYYKLRQNSG